MLRFYLASQLGEVVDDGLGVGGLLYVRMQRFDPTVLGLGSDAKVFAHSAGSGGTASVMCSLPHIGHFQHRCVERAGSVDRHAASCEPIAHLARSLAAIARAGDVAILHPDYKTVPEWGVVNSVFIGKDVVVERI